MVMSQCLQIQVANSLCCSFGAVLEEFEVLDAIEAVMTGRYENYSGSPYQ
jgi:hypothetical protein